MALKYRTIGLTVKSDLPVGDEEVAAVVSVLRSAGVTIRVDSVHGAALRCCKSLSKFSLKKRRDLQKIDALVVVGGDGTILRTLQSMANCSVPLLSIHRGTVGFLTEMTVEDASGILPAMLMGDCVIEERRRLSVDLVRNGKVFASGHALNEAVISQGAIARIIDLRILVNGEDLTVVHADGIVIATPTGSTAYSLSAGGPIVHPRISSIILTPLNPHSFSQKPIVLPGDQSVDVDVMRPRGKRFTSDVSITFDGQRYLRLRPGDRVHISTHPIHVKFLRRRGETFFTTLCTKLKWGERPVV